MKHTDPEKPDRFKVKKQRQNQKEVFKQFYSTSNDVIVYMIALLDDFAEILPEVYSKAAHLRDISYLTKRYEAEGLSFVTLTLPKLAEGLLEYLETGQGRYPSFKLRTGTDYPVFLQQLFRHAYQKTSAHHCKCVELIYQFSVAFSKFKGPYKESVLLKQLQDFVSVDEELDKIDWFDYDSFPILERARVIIEELFENFSLDDARPRPGPGATNTPVAKHMRYRPHRLYTQIDDVLPYVEFFNVNEVDVINQTKFYRELYQSKRHQPRARFKYVPKKAGKARGISIEENEMQYFQQAFKHAMYSYLEGHPYTSGCINFTEQVVNATLALLSSESLEFATLDMKEASDRVARELVSWLFQNTVLHDILMALSTKWIDLPDLGEGEQSLYTRKFAPMGSGLCFPVMACVHWALCTAILQLFSSTCPAKKVFVYGDDILVPSEDAELIFKWLPSFGMKLNKQKSFYRSHFRESCGTHAYKGKDITPVYFKFTPQKTISSAMSCIANECTMHSKGYRHVAMALRKAIRESHGDLPYVNVNSPIFGFKRIDVREPSNFYSLRTKRAWTHIHRCEPNMSDLFRVRVVVTPSECDEPPTENECYLRHVLTKAHARWIGGEPLDVFTKWQYVSYPQLCGYTEPVWVHKLFNFLGDQNETDQRKK